MACNFDLNRQTILKQSRQVAQSIAARNGATTDVVMRNKVLEVNFRPLSDTTSVTYTSALQFALRFKAAYPGTNMAAKSRRDGSAYSIVSLDDNTVEKLSKKDVYYQVDVEPTLSSAISKSLNPELVSVFLTPNTYQKRLSDYGFTQEEIDYLVEPILSNTELWVNTPTVNNLISLRIAQGAAFESTETGKEANKELDSALKEFAKSLNITVKEYESLKDDLGLSPLGIANILDKSISLAAGRKITTLPEEVAHFYVELLRKRNTQDTLTEYNLYRDLLSKIESWEKYPAIKKAYAFYGDEEKIKKEAIAKAISEAIVDRFESKSDPLKQAITEFLNWLKALFATQKNFNIRLLADDIAQKILDKDYSDISKDVDQSARLTDYKDISKDTLELISILSSFGAHLTGSMSLRKQGTVYRKPGEVFNDLDFKIPIEQREEFLKKVQEKFPNIKKDSEFGSPADSITTLWSLEYKGESYAIDFFFDKTPYSIIGDQVSWRDTFEAKLKMGREKDVTDFVNYTPFSDSSETMEKIHELLRRLEIPVQTLPQLSVANAPGVADLLNKIIQVVEGERGENALPEEAMHFVVAVVEEKFPDLYKEMEDNIWKYNIYGKTLSEYKDNPLYQKDGKPDLHKLKQEAITRLLTGLVINSDLTENQKSIDVSQRWWAKILDFFRSLFAKLTDNPLAETAFERVARQTFNEDFILPQDIKNLSQATSYLQLGTPEPEKSKKLFEILQDDMKSGRYKKVQNDKERYYEIDGKRHFMSVTEYKAQIMSKQHRFAERTDAQKFRDAFNRDWGTAIDDTINTILDRYVDPETGLMRSKPLDRPKRADGSFDLGATPIGKMEMELKKFKAPTVAKLQMYETLEGFISEFLKTFPPGTRFMWQVIVADTNAKRIIPGTIDFLAILPDATMKIFDWKSLESEYFDFDAGKNKAKDDIAWFKKKEYNIQLGEYKKMFTNSESKYARALDTPVPGRNPKRFNIEVTESRAIPIAVSFLRKKIDPTIKIWDANTIWDLDKITIGTPDWSNTWRILKPVPTSDEKTYVKELDELINKIDKIYNDLFNKRYTSKRDRDAKNRELNRLQEAKRDIQVNHHIGSTLNTLILTINRLNKELTNSDFIQIRRNLGTLSAIDGLKKSLEAVFSTLADDRRRIEAAIKTETDAKKLDLLKKQLDEVAKSEEVYDKLADVDTNINLLSGKYRERNETQIKTLADKLGIRNIFAVQRQIGFSLESFFNGKSENYIKTVQVFNKLFHEANNEAKFEFKEVHDKLLQIRNDLQKWAKDNNLTLQQAVNKLLTDKTVEGEDLRFIAKWKKDFYKERDAAIEKLSGDDVALADAVTWFIDNTEFDKAGYEREKADKIDQINNEEFDVDPKKNADARKLAIEDYVKKHDPFFDPNHVNKDAFNKNNKFLQPLDKWKTDEYVFVEKNKPLWNAYQLFREIIKDAESNGLVERWLFTRALPNMEGFISLNANQVPGKMAMNLIKQMYSEDVPMYKLDELGYPVFNITTKFTKDLGIWKERAIEVDGKAKVQLYKDYSKVSKDLFSVFMNFAESAITAKHLQNIEDASLLLLDYETSKTETIPTTVFGHTIEDVKEGKLRKEKLSPESNKNAAFLRKFILNDLYHSKDEADTPLSRYTPSRLIANQIKKINGGEEFLDRLKERARFLSFRTLLLALNSFNQLRILGFNFRAAGANLVVGLTNAWFESGDRYEFQDMVPPTSPEDFQTLLGLIDYALPGIEFSYSARDRSGQPKIVGSFNEMRKEYGILTALGNTDIQRFLYSLMRNTDKAVQYSVFLGMIRNATVVNGQIVNIPQHVKDTEEFEVGGRKVKYADRTTLSDQERDELMDKIAKKVAEIKKSSNLIKLAKTESTDLGTKATLDGVDAKSLSNFRIQVQEAIKDVLGSITEEDTSTIRMAWMGTILLTFKNWLPRQVRVRFGKFNYNSNKNAYDIGKHRLMATHLLNNTIGKDGKMKWGVLPYFLAETLGVNYYLKQLGVVKKYGYDEAVSQAYNQYADELLKRGDVETRQEADLEMPTLSEFTDLYHRKLAASFKELRTILLLTATLIAYSGLNDPDDESWWEIFAISTIKRTLYDVGFWGPNFWYNLFSKPFSFLGLFEDTSRLIKHGTLYLATDDKKEATLTRKYLMKVAPVTREYVNVRSMFDEEFRKKYEIQLKSYNW